MTRLNPAAVLALRHAHRGALQDVDDTRASLDRARELARHAELAHTEARTREAQLRAQLDAHRDAIAGQDETTGERS